MTDSRRKLGWLQFDLRTILLIAIVVCTTTAWLLERSRREEEARRLRQFQETLADQALAVEKHLQAATAATWKPVVGPQLSFGQRRELAHLHHAHLRATRELQFFREMQKDIRAQISQELRNRPK